jgi:methylmalonyl-CoA/ethylmalonyl-CoA epimerase
MSTTLSTTLGTMADAGFGLSTIGQISFPIRDLDRAVEFYRDKLGLRLQFRSPNMAFFDCGGVRLTLGPPDPDCTPIGSILYFQVTDLEAAAAILKTRGVIFEREAHRVAHFPQHDLWMAFFRDPDENMIGLICERKRE